MTSIGEIRGYAEHSLDGEVRDICLRIIDEVQKITAKNPDDPRWTFQNFAGWVGRSSSDSLLQQSVFLLCTAADRKLLDMHFFYFALEGEDDIGAPIDDAEVKEAYDIGFLVDPTSGKEVRDFEEHLAPYFVPSERLRAV